MQITVCIDPGERNSQRSIAILEAVDGNPAFKFDGFRKSLVDVNFSQGDTSFNAELKAPADLVQSILTGHLAQQVIAMQRSMTAGFIVCLGSVSDALNTVATFTKYGHRGKSGTLSDRARVRAFCADAYAFNIPVFFWDDQPMQWMLSHVYNVINGGDILSHLPRANKGVAAAAMLTMIPGVGKIVANGLLERYGSICELCESVKTDPFALEDVKVGKRRIGPKLADTIMEVLGGA